MIEDVLSRVKERRGNAQDIRRKARKETQLSERNRLFHFAATEFQKAIAELERELRRIRRQKNLDKADLCRVLEALSQTYGSLGGTWRDAGDLSKAIDLYDRGNAYEEERRSHGFRDDTYNMLQRLIVRLLKDSGCLGRQDFLMELETARTEIDYQVKSGRTDSWALADQALARFLCNAEAQSAIEELDRRKADPTFYDSAATVVAALIAEGLGKGVALGEHLESFKQLLQRKGGLR